MPARYLSCRNWGHLFDEEAYGGGTKSRERMTDWVYDTEKHEMAFVTIDYGFGHERTSASDELKKDLADSVTMNLRMEDAGEDGWEDGLATEWDVEASDDLPDWAVSAPASTPSP